MLWFRAAQSEKPADHIGRIKAPWQHPLHPSMTLEAQSTVSLFFFFFLQGFLCMCVRLCATRVTGAETLSPPYNVKPQQPANAACTCSAVRLSDEQKRNRGGRKKGVPVLSEVRVSSFGPDRAH